jgi:hypothetical protein
MKKLLLILVLAVMCSSVTRADDIGDTSIRVIKKNNKLIHEYYEKFEQKISANQRSICNEFYGKNLLFGKGDTITTNKHIFIFNRCDDVKNKFRLTKESDFNFIKYLDLKEFKFSHFYSKNYQIDIPASEIIKNSSCHMDLTNKSTIDYFEIKKRCGIKRLVVGSKAAICPHDGCVFTKMAFTEDSELKGNWLTIVDYYYADVNNDGYMDLVIIIRPDGAYSSVNNTETIVVTSFSKGEFININVKPNSDSNHSLEEHNDSNHYDY